MRGNVEPGLFEHELEAMSQNAARRRHDPAFILELTQPECRSSEQGMRGSRDGAHGFVGQPMLDIVGE